MLSDPWLLLPAVLSALVAYGLTPLVGRLATRYGIVDLPGPRRVHDRPIPRLGGAAIVVAGGLGFAILFALSPAPPHGLPRQLMRGLGLGILPILLASAADDARGLGPGPRFLAQFAGAAIAVACGVALNPSVHLFGREIAVGVLAVPLSVMWIVGVTNAFNLIDGLDGLSAGCALISAGSLVGVFVLAGQPAMALTALVVVGALVGFLPHNLHPARIFMGDVGAAAVGFCLACLTLKGGSTLTAGFATVLPVGLLVVPLADTVLSFLRRLVRRLDSRPGPGVFEADRDHIHHRLLALGIDQRRAVLILYAVAAGCACFALLSIMMTARESGLLLTGLLLAGLVGVSRLGYEEFAVIRNGFVLKFYDAPMLRKSLFAVFADLVMVAVGVYAAVSLKYDDPWLQVQRQAAFRMLAVLAPVTVVTLWSFGIYRGTWRLAGVEDFFRLCVGVAVSAFAAYLVYDLMFSRSASLTLFVTYAAVKVIIASGSRVSYKLLLASGRRASRDGVPTVIYGAGHRGDTVLRQIRSNGTGMRAVAFVDDDGSRAGKAVSGVPIVGGVERLHDVLMLRSARRLIVSTPKIPAEKVDAARRICENLGVEVLRMSIAFEPLGAPLAPVSFEAASEGALRAEARFGLAQPLPPDLG